MNPFQKSKSQNLRKIASTSNKDKIKNMPCPKLVNIEDLQKCVIFTICFLLSDFFFVQNNQAINLKGLNVWYSKICST